MTSENELHYKGFSEISQSNIRSIGRNAGRDYYEYQAFGSLKDMLATMTTEELDQRSTENSRFFKIRFGFEPSTAIRRDIVQLRAENDFTDSELRRMYYAGRLDIRSSPVKLIDSNAMPLWGKGLGIVCSIYAILMCTPLMFSNISPLKQGLGCLFYLSTYIGETWVLHNFFIAPWRPLIGSDASNSRQ
jgi:hypothetical protein